MESKPREPAELIEKRNGDIADQSTALRTLVGVQSWPDIALSAIEEGDEAFAGEIVGLVEQRLRRMS